jgi:hypothetical protein
MVKQSKTKRTVKSGHLNLKINYKELAYMDNVLYICEIILKLNEMDKDLRDQKIIDLHNQGKSIRSIASKLNIGKTTVSNVVNVFLGLDKIPSKEVVPVKFKGTEERFTSFVGWDRLNVNEYVNEKTGEVIRVAWVKAKSNKEFGYFVKLGSVGKIENVEVVSEEVKNDKDDMLLQRMADDGFNEFINYKD